MKVQGSNDKSGKAMDKQQKILALKKQLFFQENLEAYGL